MPLGMVRGGGGGLARTDFLNPGAILETGWAIVRALGVTLSLARFNRIVGIDPPLSLPASMQPGGGGSNSDSKTPSSSSSSP